MQIYKGLDIATNKITEDESGGIPHHLMSFVDATNSEYNIHQFREQGLKFIEKLSLSAGNPPMVCKRNKIETSIHASAL
ncbi:hypothetical protein KIN20_029453 [Parelaphostrongylus tenuis]|uniref:Uncharacterized protein n=1 Tax=Parelaphostrongylus tenuis TaxID=148309 RepID=A0AAD5R2I5_PARTN|nr:hypothetical protein KIN20_029453 [Parelaphostrongylus tenuis]